MPWNNLAPLEEINRFIQLAKSGQFCVTDLCEPFGTSRKTRLQALGVQRGARPGRFGPAQSPAAPFALDAGGSRFKPAA